MVLTALKMQRAKHQRHYARATKSPFRHTKERRKPGWMCSKIDGSFIITRAQDLAPSHIDELTTKLMSKYHKLCHR